MNKQINEIWDELEEMYPNKSTEWLMTLTCDLYQERHGQEIDHGDVALALFEEADAQERA